MNEKNNNIRAGHARDEMRSGRVSLFVRAFVSEKRNIIRVGHARDGMRSGRMTVFVVRRGLVERKGNIVLGWAMQGIGWDQDG